jgi:hypothetical protein
MARSPFAARKRVRVSEDVVDAPRGQAVDGPGDARRALLVSVSCEWVVDAGGSWLDADVRHVFMQLERL